MELISKQAAIDAMCELMHHWFGGDPKDEIREIKRELEKLPSVQPEQKWIPCKTGILPEEKDEFYQATYLLDDGDRIVDYAYFNSKGMWSNCAYEPSELLAWMPLPEPYRAERRTDE